MTKPKKTKKSSKASGPTPAVSSPVWDWFEQRFKILSISVLVLASVLRIGLLAELPDMPFNQLHRHDELDMNFFDLWGDRIAAGDILTDTIWHPYHVWHDAVAKSFGLHTEEQGKAQWGEWYGGTQYHQEPLYPLIIGLCKMTGPHGRWLVYLLQMIAGVFSIWMIMWLGRHYFGAMAGITGGLLFTLYGQNLLLDATLLRTSFNTTLLLGMLFGYEKLMKGELRPWVMGVIGGIGYLLMTTSMLLWIPLVARWFYLRKSERRSAGWMTLGFGVCLSFLVARNAIAEAPLLSTSSVGPITYMLSNFPKYRPEMGFAFFPEAGQLMESTGGKMLPVILKTIDIHPSFWSWVQLQLDKFALIFHWYEIPNNINTYLAMQFSSTLQLTIIPWSVIAALGVAGMLMRFRSKRSFSLLVGVLTQIAIMVIFYVLCRFRVPLVAMMAIYAGYTLQQITHFRKWRPALLAGVGSVIALLIINRSTPEIPVKFEKGDVASLFQLYYVDRLDAALNAQQFDTCIPMMKELIHTMPAYMDDIQSNGELRTEAEKDLAQYYGALYTDLGNIYQQKGDAAQAEACYAKSKKLKR